MGTNPYGTAAQIYWKKAWYPFPVKGKHEAIPKGVTGIDAPDVSWKQIQEWTEKRPFSNVAVRASGWIAIDVDGPDGVEAFIKAQNEIGDLPDTWRSTSWGSAHSAERFQAFYRVPVGFSARLAEGRFRKRFGEHVDIIHRGHRYSIVAPSVHPNNGRPYAWYGPDGEPSKVPDRLVLPELPPPWLDFLREQASRISSDTNSSSPNENSRSASEDWYEEAEDDGGDDRWTETAARAEVDRMLDRIRTVDANINTQAGGAMREIGRFAPALFTVDEAIALCRDTLGAEPGQGNPHHSDTWNAANGKDWTAATLAATSVTRGAEEARCVGAAAETVPAPSGDVVENVAGAALELPAPGLPMDVARELRPMYPLPLTWWRGDFYGHQGAHWARQDDAEIRGWVRLATEHATYLKPVKGKDGEITFEALRWAPTIGKVKEVVAALGEGVLQRAGDEDKVTALENGIVTEDRTLIPHSPAVFNLTSRPFAYDPEARCPGWVKFLDEVLPDSPDDQAFLQEWFGYVLSGRTDIHVVASLAGESRSGKGTILRLLTAATGTENVAAGRLDTLAGDFGMQSLIGKSLLTFGDVRWSNSKAPIALQRILEISGEDKVVIPRKNRDDWEGTLGVRIMFAGNEIPRFSDPSRAMSNRLRIVHFRQSFAGREDYGLTDRLMQELPGIFNWALDGRDRLRAGGRFTESESSVRLRERVSDGGDPYGAFAEEYLSAEDGAYAIEDEVVEAYDGWCKRTRRTRDTATADTLRSALLDLFPGVRNGKETRRSKRTAEGPRKVRAFEGLRLHVETAAYEQPFE